MGRSPYAKEFVRYSKEELTAARETDMVDFLERQNGFSFKQDGSSYRCREHNSLVISQNRRRWYWNSRKIGGNNVLDWLQSVEGLDFQSACRVVISKGSYDFRNFNTAPKSDFNIKKPFVLPEAVDGQYKRVYTYLAYTRNIGHEIIQHCFSNKLIYQDKKSNAVFVGYNEQGEAKFTEIKSTSIYPYAFGRFETKELDVTLVFLNSIMRNSSYKCENMQNCQYDFLSEENASFKEMKGHKFRGNVTGSDKSYSFHIDAVEKTDRVFVFEAPIDLLAHATINNMKAKATGNPNWKNAFLKHNRLSLSGTSDTAITPYLNRHPEIKNIVLCLDNDSAGQHASEQISAKYTSMGYSVTSIPSKRGKDYAEYLDILTQKSAESRHKNYGYNSP